MRRFAASNSKHVPIKIGIKFRNENHNNAKDYERSIAEVTNEVENPDNYGDALL